MSDRKKLVVEVIETPESNPEPVQEEKPAAGVPPEISEAPVAEGAGKSGINPFWIIGPGILLLGALLGGILAYQKGLSNIKVPTPTPVSTIAPEATPTASPEAQIDLTKFPIKVLNGSGIKGEAGKARIMLEKAGFEISTAGNAQTYDYTKTEIQAKKDVDDSFMAKLKETLAESYSVENKVQTLTAPSSDSVIVIIGKSSK